MACWLAQCAEPTPAQPEHASIRPETTKSAEVDASPEERAADAGRDAGGHPPAADAQAAEPLVPDRHGRPMPARCREALRLLEYLADKSSYSTGSEPFNPKRIGRLEVSKLLELIHPNGFVDEDAGHRSTRRFSQAEIKQQVARRSGPAFKRLAHLGHIYAQYSRVECATDAASIWILIPHWYELGFAAGDEGRYLLEHVGYLMREDK
jgi:hypothetical protein